MIVKKTLPPVPEDIIAEAYASTQAQNRAVGKIDEKLYQWFPATDKLNSWCQQHIADGTEWGVQVITGDLPIHKDTDARIKYNYIVDTGGVNVVTYFYNNDEKVTQTMVCEQNNWYLLKVDSLHSVSGVTGTRIMITGGLIYQ